MTDTTKGVVATIMACVLWGMTGWFYNQIAHLSAWQIMAHRTLWSCVIFLALLGLQRRFWQPFVALRPSNTALVICISSVLVAANYLIFVYAVQIDKALEASMGYFIFPLVAVLIGRLFFSETLGRWQGGAVLLAFCAVLVLTWGLGVAPWIALLLAITFGYYGLLKKRLAVGPVVSVTAESLLLLPIAIVFLIVIQVQGAEIWGESIRDVVFLVLSGPMTAIPLILFSYASRRITMTTTGLLHYLNPTLQFIVATLVLKEPFGLWHAIAFAMIWCALMIYSVASWRQERAAPNADESCSTSATSRM